MLLRSSSTPILGSLLSSSTPFFSESPNTTHHNPKPALQPFSCHFSPLSDSPHRHPAPSGVRRTRSDGNLHALLSDHPDDSHHHPSLRCPSSRRPNPVLETIPSFSIYNAKCVEKEGEPPEREEEEEEEEEKVLQRPVTAGGSMGREFSFSGEKQDAGLAEKIGAASGKVTPPLFLARGLGIDRVGSGLMNAGGGAGGGGGRCHTGSNEGDQSDMETYYKRMVDEDPSNGLFLRNYAQFLHQIKGDPQRAEEYYSRAVLAEPDDGEILSQYAKLVWELHRDEEWASSYFDRAVQAAPQDSHVLAAYAGFLWETEDDDGVGEVDGIPRDYAGPLVVNHEVLASASI